MTLSLFHRSFRVICDVDPIVLRILIGMAGFVMYQC